MKLWEGLLVVAVAVSLMAGVGLAQDNPAAGQEQPKTEPPKTDAPKTEPAKQDAKKKGAAGVLGLPDLATLKEKCKTTEEQNAKLDEIYKEASAKDAEIKKTAKDSGDRKAAAASVKASRMDFVVKIKDVLNDEQDKTFDSLAPAEQPKKKKKPAQP